MEHEIAGDAALDDAPIVGGDDVIDAGGDKVMALLQSQDQNPEGFARYRQALKARGFDTSRFVRPILIRRRLNALTPEERAGFVIDPGKKDPNASGIGETYGPALARLMEGALPAALREALQTVAADWRRLRLAAKEGAPWMEATPHLKAAAMALAYGTLRPTAALILDGEVVGSGFTEAAYGFLRLMYVDAALTETADAATIAERLRACILALETQDDPAAPVPEASGAGEGAPTEHARARPASLAERATRIARAVDWAAEPLLETAQLSATTDFDALWQVAALNDLPAIRLMKRWLERMGNEPEAAARTGAIAETWLGDMGEVLRRRQPEATKESSTVVDRVRAATRSAFDLEALACMLKHRARGFDALPGKLRAALLRHGLDPEAWDRIGAADSIGMVDPAQLSDGDLPRLSAALASAPDAFFALDPEAYPVSSMAASFTSALSKTGGARFAAHFPALLAMTTIAALALQLKHRLRNEPGPDLQTPRAWVSAFLQSGAARLAGDLMAGIGDAVDGFAHENDAPDLGGALARFLRSNATGGPLWYARRGADRLLWDALQKARGRDIAAAYARMAQRSQAELGGHPSAFGSPWTKDTPGPVPAAG